MLGVEEPAIYWSDLMPSCMHLHKVENTSFICIGCTLLMADTSKLRDLSDKGY